MKTVPEKPLHTHSIVEHASKNNATLGDFQPIPSAQQHTASTIRRGEHPQHVQPSKNRTYMGEWEDKYRNLEVMITGNRTEGKTFPGIIQGHTIRQDGEIIAQVKTYHRASNTVLDINIRKLRELQ